MYTVQKLLKICARVQEIHRLDQQKQHSDLGQSKGLWIMCILPLQHGRFMYFGLMGSHNQLCTFHTLINLWVTNLFYIHARHQMIKAARQDKNEMLQSGPLSVGHLLSDMMSALCGSPNQPLRHDQKHQSVFLNISLQT